MAEAEDDDETEDGKGEAGKRAKEKDIEDAVKAGNVRSYHLLLSQPPNSHARSTAVVPSTD